MMFDICGDPGLIHGLIVLSMKEVNHKYFFLSITLRTCCVANFWSVVLKLQYTT